MSTPNTTTLSAAVAKNDTTVLVAAITNLSAGCWLKIDNELFKVLSVPSAATTPVPVLRGQEGTAQVAHNASAQVLIGVGPSNLVAGDWGQAQPGAVQLGAASIKPWITTNYAASGAITVPTPGSNGIAILDGTSALTMTLANPSSIQDGDLLAVVANGKAAHTVTISSGIGNGGASFDVGTFSASLAVGCILMAVGGFWVLVANGIAGATAATAGPTWG